MMKKPPVKKQRAPLVERERRAHLDYKDQKPELQDETVRILQESIRADLGRPRLVTR